MAQYQKNYPEGAYTVKVVNQVLTQSQQKGTPCLALQVEVLRAANKNESKGVIYGGKREVKFWLTDKTLDKTKAFLKAAGFNGHTLAQLDPEHPEFISLEGFEFNCSCKHNVSETTGKTYDDFSAYPVKSAWGSDKSKTNTGRLMMLDALFGCNNVPAPAKKAPVTVQTEPGQDFFDDTIPF